MHEIAGRANHGSNEQLRANSLATPLVAMAIGTAAAAPRSPGFHTVSVLGYAVTSWFLLLSLFFFFFRFSLPRIGLACSTAANAIAS
jgi:hypothetical protein